mmetsp:Transcript_32362/g.97517  ORF Transcript_32362/g.97517 Transcript_32362/m.97517 type:complete len:80 (+) Transcript_32362:375-614(+)
MHDTAMMHYSRSHFTTTRLALHYYATVSLHVRVTDPGLLLLTNSAVTPCLHQIFANPPYSGERILAICSALKDLAASVL